MGVAIYDQQQITGISNSGVTDGTGVWSTVAAGVQLTALPVGCPGLILHVVNTSTSPRWAGLRTTGETTAEFQKDFTQSGHEFWFVPFNGVDTDLDFYQESTEVQFRVIAALDSTFTLVPIDDRVLIPHTNNILTLVTATGCPANSTAITTGTRWCPTSESTTFANTLTGEQLVKLDSNSQFKMQGFANASIIGYTTGTVDWSAWLSDILSVTADSTWRNLPPLAGKRLQFITVDKSATTSDYIFRANGSAYTKAVGSAFDENFFAPLDASGDGQYLIETGATATIYAMASLPDTESSLLISSLDQSVTGLTSTADFNIPFAATSFSITGDTITKNAAASTVDGDTASFVIPQWIDLETCVALGDIVITATDGVDTTADFSAVLAMQYQHPDSGSPVAFASVVLTSVGAEAMAVSPTLQVGSQVAFDASRCNVGLDGRVTFDSYSGQSALWYRNPDDKIARLVIIDTSGGSTPSVDRGLTARGLTAVGLTATGLTSVGL